VPISIYVTVELIRAVLVRFCFSFCFSVFLILSNWIINPLAKKLQSYLIAQDEEMYDAHTNTACVPRAWNLGDDLGMIEYIFSDKTGTLTCNVRITLELF
jgi:phospholipid-translocating ATPase